MLVFSVLLNSLHTARIVSVQKHLIERILTGKLPGTYNATYVHAICQRVPPPSADGSDTCKTRLGKAVRELQHVHFLSHFGWTQVSAEFKAKGRCWWAKDGKRPSGQGKKHVWDYLSLERKGYCTVV